MQRCVCVGLFAFLLACVNLCLQPVTLAPTNQMLGTTPAIVRALFRDLRYFCFLTVWVYFQRVWLEPSLPNPRRWSVNVRLLFVLVSFLVVSFAACTVDHYCERRTGTPPPCPDYSTTNRLTGADSKQKCLCSAGYAPSGATHCAGWLRLVVLLRVLNRFCSVFCWSLQRDHRSFCLLRYLLLFGVARFAFFALLCSC